MMKEMDVKALIEQIETKEEDFILTALETYNKEVTVTRELFHKVFYCLSITAQWSSIQKSVISNANLN